MGGGEQEDGIVTGGIYDEPSSLESFLLGEPGYNIVEGELLVEADTPEADGAIDGTIETADKAAETADIDQPEGAADEITLGEPGYRIDEDWFGVGGSEELDGGADVTGTSQSEIIAEAALDEPQLEGGGVTLDEPGYWTSEEWVRIENEGTESGKEAESDTLYAETDTQDGEITDLAAFLLGEPGYSIVEEEFFVDTAESETQPSGGSNTGDTAYVSQPYTEPLSSNRVPLSSPRYLVIEQELVENIPPESFETDYSDDTTDDLDDSTDAAADGGSVYHELEAQDDERLGEPAYMIRDDWWVDDDADSPADHITAPNTGDIDGGLAYAEPEQSETAIFGEPEWREEEPHSIPDETETADTVPGFDETDEFQTVSVSEPAYSFIVDEYGLGGGEEIMEGPDTVYDYEQPDDAGDAVPEEPSWQGEELSNADADPGLYEQIEKDPYADDEPFFLIFGETPADVFSSAEPIEPDEAMLREPEYKMLDESFVIAEGIEETADASTVFDNMDESQAVSVSEPAYSYLVEGYGIGGDIEIIEGPETTSRYEQPDDSRATVLGEPYFSVTEDGVFITEESWLITETPGFVLRIEESADVLPPLTEKNESGAIVMNEPGVSIEEDEYYYGLGGGEAFWIDKTTTPPVVIERQEIPQHTILTSPELRFDPSLNEPAASMQETIIIATEPPPQKPSSPPSSPPPLTARPAPSVELTVIEEFTEEITIERISFIDKLIRGQYYVQVGGWDKSRVIVEAQKHNTVYPVAIMGNRYLLIGPLNEGESNAVAQRFRAAGYVNAFVVMGK
jgi:hypothetical protein